MLDEHAVFVDLETTGANPLHDRITEIGVVEVRHGEAVREWSSLIQPQAPIPPYIEAMTGISNAMVADAPRFARVAEELLDLLRGRLFVAHNARFDYGFLRNEFRRAGIEFQEKVLCTVRLSRRLWPEQRSHSLDALIARHGLDCAARHRALGDAKVLWEFVRRVVGSEPRERVREACKALLKNSSAAPNLAPDAVHAMPDTPGVYRFYGENGALLYVGKSVNLRSRVLAHFAGDHASAREMRMALEVRHVDWIETAGELGALLREAQIVKRDAPIHNRALRRASQHWSIAIVPALAPACHGVRLIDGAEIVGDSLARCYGLFRGRRQAEQVLLGLAGEHALCHKLLGLDKREGACFAHQLKRCRGACVGLERAEEHNARLLAALLPLRLKSWPWPGRIGIREHDDERGRTDLHVFDRWCYLGTVSNDADLQLLLEERQAPAFDLDTFRIVQRHIAKAGRMLEVVPMWGGSPGDAGLDAGT